MTSKGLDEDAIAERADTWIRILSWIIPLGLFPIASEAFGTRKPLATWTITAVTVLASAVFMPVAWGFLEAGVGTLNLMQWSGNRQAMQKKIGEAIREMAKYAEAPESRDHPRPGADGPGKRGSDGTLGTQDAPNGTDRPRKRV